MFIELMRRRTPLVKILSRVMLVLLLILPIIIACIVYSMNTLSAVTAGTPVISHLRQLEVIKLIVCVLGILVVITLIIIMFVFDSHNQKSLTYSQLMLDAMPISCSLWDRDFNVIDCNLATLQLFNLSSKSDFGEKFFVLSPEYQPCGKTSREKAAELLDMAFRDGQSHSEWNHRRIDGVIIPCDVTLIRVDYKDDQIVAGYIRDLRDLKSC